MRVREGDMGQKKSVSSRSATRQLSWASSFVCACVLFCFKGIGTAIPLPCCLAYVVVSPSEEDFSGSKEPLLSVI